VIFSRFLIKNNVNLQLQKPPKTKSVEKKYPFLYTLRADEALFVVRYTCYDIIKVKEINLTTDMEIGKLLSCKGISLNKGEILC